MDLFTPDYDEPEMPDPPPDPPAVQTRSSAEVVSAAKKQRRRTARRTPGVTSTLFTGGLGVPASSGSFGSSSVFGR